MSNITSAPAGLTLTGPAPHNTPPPRWALLAALAVLLPTLVAFNEPPSVTFYNQALAALGWGVFLCCLGRSGWSHQAWATAPRVAAWPMGALWSLMGLQAAAALWAVWHGPLPLGLGLMAAGLSLAAALAAQGGWWLSTHEADEPRTAFFLALMLAGAVGMAIALIQVFIPGWTDGQVLAKPTVAGRAVGNLRQPNHFSSLLVMAVAACVWLGASRKLPGRWMGALALLCIAGVVLSASRTGMVAMLLLALWGALDRQLPGRWRLLLLSSPLVYGLVWWGMAGIAQLGVAFAAEARLRDGSDVSSSRFDIWRNTLALIAQHPWQGVGWGSFNAAWTFTPFPDRPRAFFDHAHNLPLHWMVELGLPMGLLLVSLAAATWWALVRPLGHPWSRRAPSDATPTVGACALIVSALGLHSLLEYPLWYAHLLLPTAFAWGLGLGAAQRERTRAAAGDDAIARPAPQQRPGTAVLVMGGGLMAVATLWNIVDYRLAAEIYAPWARQVALPQRIATSQVQPWWGHQADYAAVTSKHMTAAPPEAFQRTLMNLIDARLMMSYARALAAAGEVDKARAVSDRLREFRNPAAQEFFAVCDQKTEIRPPAFQCQPAGQTYRWDELLPQSRRQ